MANIANEILLTPREVADRWKVHNVSVLRRIKNGSLPAVRLSGRAIRIRLSDVEKLEREATA
jgi:excisionase family DNA binding protein